MKNFKEVYDKYINENINHIPEKIDESTAMISPQQYNAMLFNYSKDFNNPKVAYFSYVVNQKGKNMGNSPDNVFTFEMDHMEPVGATGWMRTKDSTLRHDFMSKSDLINFVLQANGAIQRMGGRFLKTSAEVLKRLMSPLIESKKSASNIVEYHIMLNKNESGTNSLISDLRAYVKSLKVVFNQEFKKEKADWKKKTAGVPNEVISEPLEKVAEIEVEDEVDTKLVIIRIEDEAASNKLMEKFKTRIEKTGFLDEF